MSACRLAPRHYLNIISAQLGHGNRYGLVGANGCGKLTFMKMFNEKQRRIAQSCGLDTRY